MTRDADGVFDLRGWLDRHAEGDELVLGYGDVRSLFDELQRQRQSADRLRKQNRKVRVKIDRIRAEYGAPADNDESVD